MQIYTTTVLHTLLLNTLCPQWSRYWGAERAAVFHRFVDKKAENKDDGRTTSIAMGAFEPFIPYRPLLTSCRLCESSQIYEVAERREIKFMMLDDVSSNIVALLFSIM